MVREGLNARFPNFFQGICVKDCGQRVFHAESARALIEMPQNKPMTRRMEEPGPRRVGIGSCRQTALTSGRFMV